MHAAVTGARVRAFAWLVLFLPSLACAQAAGAEANAKTESDFTTITARFSSLFMGNTIAADGTMTAGFYAEQIHAYIATTTVNGKVFKRVRIISRSCPNPMPDKLLCADAGGVYYASDSEYQSKQLSGFGIATGILAVPFKYHLKDHATTSGSTLGGYIGLSNLMPSVGQFSIIAGGGLALVPATSDSSTTSQGNTLTGITIAVGVIGKVGTTNTQFGVLLGYDMVDKAANYKYDAKPWLSFTVGYAFSN